MGKFKIGTIVKIRKDSMYYDKGDHNPKDVKGKITHVNEGDDHHKYVVEWYPLSHNVYREKDLELADKIQFKKSYYSFPNTQCIKPIYDWLISIGLTTEYESDRDSLQQFNYVFINSTNYEFHFGGSSELSYTSSIEELYELGLPKITFKEEIPKPEYKVGDRVISADNNIGVKDYENLIGTIIRISNASYKYLIKFDEYETEIYCNVKCYAPDGESPIPKEVFNFNKKEIQKQEVESDSNLKIIPIKSITTELLEKPKVYYF